MDQCDELTRNDCRVAAHALGCLGLLLFLGARASADPIYSLERITRQDGLPQSSVRAVDVDAAGFLWIGTETGVARYDGYRFKEIAPPFGSGVVLALHVDSRNRVWTRWYGKPYMMYDSTRDEWQQVGEPDFIAAHDGFLEDAGGTVWLTNSSKLQHYDDGLRRLVAVDDLEVEFNAAFEQTIAFHRDLVWTEVKGATVGIDPARYNVVQRVRTGAAAVRLWTHGAALWRCDGDGVYRLQEHNWQWLTIYSVPSHQLSACEIAKDGAVWIGTKGDGVLRQAEGVERRFKRVDNDRTSLADDFVLRIKSDSRGHVWVITPGNAHRWHGARFERFEFSPDSQRDNPGGPSAYVFHEDRSGVLWFGSEDRGLAKISPWARKAQLLAPPSQVNSHVRTPVVDRDGNIWVGMNQDGVFRFNAASETWTHFPASVDDATKLPTAEVRALVATRGGDIWAGSQRSGIISRYVPATRSWRRFDAGGSNKNYIYNFLEHPNGRLLLGREWLVSEFDPLSGVTRDYSSQDHFAFRASTLSLTGRVFFGAHQGGVKEFELGKGFTRTWQSELSDPNVFALYEDRFGLLWIGTWGGGLNRLDTATNAVQVIRSKDGLPDDTIFGILPGKHDDLWLSTNNGLARVENCVTREWPCRPKISVLDSSNGLPFSEFDAEAHALAPNGELLFGGYDGLVRFDPDKIELNLRPPQLQFSAIYLEDKLLPAVWLLGGKSQPLELAHAFGTLKVQFSSLDFNATANNRYRYRLSSSGKWLSLGAVPELVLNSLDSGPHVLEVMGSNNDGVWSEGALKLDIRVLPPWYRSVFAWSTYLILLLGGVVLWVKWRERRLRANTARLEATVTARTRELAAANAARDEFYANVSHEIRTPLTLLVGTAQSLKSNPEQNCDGILTDDLVRHSDSLRRYVESLITVSHLQSSPNIAWIQEDLSLFLRSVIADFRRIADATSITLAAPAGNCFVRTYASALDTIFSNLLINALRHTPSGGSVAVVVVEHPQSIEIRVVDSGAGLEPGVLASLFERGTRGERASRANSGYGIGLNLVKQTVLALGGSISARNEPGQGACFLVTLARADDGLPVASYTRAPLTIASNDRPSRGPVGLSTAAKGRGAILIIEDHDELRVHIAELFAPHYRIREASTVASGLSIAKKHLPDLVICDVMLPDGEGFDVVTALKSDAITDHISVVLLTALADDASRLRGLKEQADLYITKPFLREELQLQVTNLMNQRRRLRRTAARETWAAKAVGSATAATKGISFETRLLTVVEELHSDSDCSVSTLAERLALSRKQLERKTRYCFKCSPNALLNRFRLDRAVILLQDGIRVAEVAARCGFASQSHFGALFKRRFGYAPSKRKSEPDGSITV